MAVIIRPGNLGNRIVEIRGINATPSVDVLSGGGTIYAIHVDNSLGLATVYFKIADSLTFDVGVDAPNRQVVALAGQKATRQMPEGVVYSTGISMACTSAPGTSGVGNPAQVVNVQLVTN